MRRDQLDAELKDAIEEKLSPWGIDIIDVEVRDIVVPKELQEAMAMEAVAERKKTPAWCWPKPRRTSPRC